MENTQQEPQKEDLISDYVNELREWDIEEYKLSVKKARNTLFLVSVLIFIGEIFGMAIGGSFDITILIVALIEAGIFVALALWTKRKPYYAVLGGIIIFIGIHLLAIGFEGYVNGTGAAAKVLMSGIIIKIAIIVTLFRALGNAKAIQNHSSNLHQVE